MAKYKAQSRYNVILIKYERRQTHFRSLDFRPPFFHNNQFQKTQNPSENLRICLKIQMFCDINLARLVSRHFRHLVKKCHQLGCFRSKCNIEVAIKTADLMLGKKYSTILTTTYGGFIHHILEQNGQPPQYTKMWYWQKGHVKL